MVLLLFHGNTLSNPFSQGQRLSLDINISMKYLYARKHNKNEKATEIIYCDCNENQGVQV